MWRIARPADRPAAPAQRRRDRRAAAAHRPLPQRPQARHDRGRLSPRPSRPATISIFAGLSLEVEQFKDTDIIVRASSKRGADRHLRRAAHVDVDPPRQPRPPHARRPQRLAPLPRRRARMARGAVRALGAARAAPAAGRDLPARGPAFHGRLQLRGLERAPVARHADHPADGERGPEAARLRRQRLCARLLRARADHRPEGAVLGRHPRAGVRRLGRKLVPAQDRVPRGRGDRRAGRAPASGQEARPGGRSASRPTSSTTCCAATSPSICCCAPRGTMRGGG